MNKTAVDKIIDIILDNGYSDGLQPIKDAIQEYIKSTGFEYTDKEYNDLFDDVIYTLDYLSK